MQIISYESMWDDCFFLHDELFIIDVLNKIVDIVCKSFVLMSQLY